MNSATRWALTGIVVIGLGIDAYTHLDLAHDYVFNRTSTISQGTLFRIEAVLAILAGVAVIVRAAWWSALIAFAVAAGGLAALLIYRYVNVGTLGPLPNMYEPIWFAEKSWCALGEGLGALGALALLAQSAPHRRSSH
jgi:hypothetical protein